MSDSEDEMSSGNEDVGTDKEQDPETEMVDAQYNGKDNVAEGDKKHWNKSLQLSLVQAVRSALTPELVPYSEVTIDWKKIQTAVGISDCEQKFKRLLSSVRHFRTMDEITVDILTLLRAPELTESNKMNDQKSSSMGKNSPNKRKKRDPNLPKKPQSGYNLYTSEVMKNSILSFADVSMRWKQMSNADKAKYTEMHVADQERYMKELQKYVQEHPEDKDVKKELNLATAALQKNKANHGKMLNSSSIKHYLTKPKTPTRDKDSAESQEMDASSLDTSLSVTPKKKRHSEDSPMKSPSPKKKKRKSERIWTAESLYVDAKRQEYSEAHPEFDDETIESKLARKFAKMSQSKQAKYQRLADEKNS